MSSATRYAVIAALLGCSALGYHACLGSIAGSGLGESIRAVANGSVPTVVGAPRPFKRDWTGHAKFDETFSLLVAFFGAALSGDFGWSRTLFFAWGMGQFGAAWTLIMLEGRRSGNKGRLVSWVGTMGLFIQTISWTVTVPLYCALHLLTSPVARLRNGDGEAARRNLFVLLWDLTVLPMSVTIAFLVPTVAMMMPDLGRQSAATHWSWVAIWQPFPAVNVLLQTALHSTCYFLFGSLIPRDDFGEPTTPGKGFSVAVTGVYEFVLTLCYVSHLPVLALALLPNFLREALIKLFPRNMGPLFGQQVSTAHTISFANVFVPYPLHSDDPALFVNPATYGSGDLGVKVINFLQYDIYIGLAAVLLWAMYLRQIAVKGKPSVVGVVAKAAGWTLVGGPAAACAALLWERDEVVKEGEKPGKKE